MISFGPYVSRAEEARPFGPELERTGCRLEFASEQIHVALPIYRRIDPSMPAATHFWDFLIHESDFPFQPARRPFDSIDNGFIPMDGVISTLYRGWGVSLPLTDLLADFHSLMPFFEFDRDRIAGGTGFVDSRLASEGIGVGGLFCYGRTITVHLAWMPKSSCLDHEQSAGIHAAGLVLRPRPDRTLACPRWLEPHETTLAFLFTARFRKMYSGNEVKVLSEAGRQFVLDRFKWTKLALMTNREARLARVEFARNHLELLDRPRDLVAALKAAGLYAEATPASKILRNISPIMEAARAV